MRVAMIALAALVHGFAALYASAQQVPFFAGGATGFDPEVSVVNSGEVLDAQAVVSHDRRYVTINARAQSSRLLALREFSFAGGGRAVPLGFVGLGLDDDDNDRNLNVLNRAGMNLVARLED
jgi:hypothetical protein